MNLLEVRHLSVSYPAARGWTGRSRLVVRAVEDVSFTIAAGETVGLVGESGCGKSTLGRALVRLIDVDQGEIWFDGENLAALRGQALRRRRRGFQMVFQDPFGSLNPRLTIAQSLSEPLEIHGLAKTRAELTRRVVDLLRQVGLDPAMTDRYPHELSGGQRQRIGIARALAVEPRLLVCDEPVSALDVSVQAQIVNLLVELQGARGLASLFIAHDLAVVEHLSQHVLVMYLGRVVESGPTRAVLGSPRHPYTEALKSAVLTLDSLGQSQRILLPGEAPSPLAPPPGCPFHPRCPHAEARCRVELPALRELAPGHHAACHLAMADAAR